MIYLKYFTECQKRSYCRIMIMLLHICRETYEQRFLIGQECYQKFSYIMKIVNPPAFENGMSLENRVKIEGGMSKKLYCKGPNFWGLFGGLKLKIFLKKRIFGMTLDRHYPILRSKSKSKKLTAHWLFFGPLLFQYPNYDKWAPWRHLSSSIIENDKPQ